jgi:hypothetical protein
LIGATAWRFCGSPTIFCVLLLRDPGVEHPLGERPLEPRVLVLELARPLQFVTAHAAKLPHPAAVSRFAKPHSELGRSLMGIGAVQADDVMYRKEPL